MALPNVIARVGAMFGIEATDRTRALQAQLADSAHYLIPWRQQYAILRRYYQNNGLYQQLQSALVESNLWLPGMQPLRNPTNRIIEFYAAHLWPGPAEEALEIEAENEAIVDPIHQVWTWSNWTAQKQVIARDLALYGDAFIKVASDRPGMVYLQRLEPETVTDLDPDQRGFLTYLRLDVPYRARVGDYWHNRIHTEVWDKVAGTLRVWDQEMSPDALPNTGGTPQVALDMRSDLGIDFIPVVHAKFKDVGDERGQSAIMPVIDKVDETNRQATRLAQIMFRYNKPLWAASGGGIDKDGRPLPAPDFGADQTVALADDTVLGLPGTQRLDPLVPNLNYEAYRNLLLDSVAELEQDCPEMGYAKLFERVGADMSGRAIRFALSPAIARVEEARGNAHAALVRADQIALTLAQVLALPDFGSLGGTYEDGAFDHSFKVQDVLPASRAEDVEFEKAQADAVAAKVAAGWSERQALEDVGLSEQEIEIMQQERASVDVIPPTGQ